MYFVSFITKNLSRRPVRTALTVLGLSVAVGSMIALLGISHNVESTVAEGFERRGVDIVVMQGGVADQLSSELDEKLLDRVVKIEGVDPAGLDIALIQFMELQRTKGGDSKNIIGIGWPASNFGFEDLQILSGRRLREGDTRKVMLGATVADNEKKAVGDTIYLQTEPFEVIGIYKSFSVFENGAVVILLEEAHELNPLRKGSITGFSMRVKKSAEHPDADVEAVRLRILDLKDEKTGKSLRLSAQTTKEYVKSASHVQLVKAMSWMVSVIAIVIGVISMLDTMIMSVLERTQEIGILRAVGWPRSRVVKMVLIEAVVLSLAAAAIGSIGAILLTYILTLFPKVNGFIESGIAPVVLLQGFLFTLLIGLLGAAYPAIRAARLLPTEAIRHD
jgi:putative ABC transport system permease protein